jgi:sucrose phosphorylase
MGIRAVRLDAIGYVTKKPGTSCFMVEPEIYQTLDWLIDIARSFGLELLPEVHDHYTVQDKLSAKGYWTYDFVLPGLILFTLQNRSGGKLKEYLATMPGHRFTMLDCHDGIPVQPDLDGVLELEESKRMVDLCLDRGANLNRILSGTHMPHPGFDAHQINCTYYSALNGNDDAYLAARALQFFAPGIPQVYYVGLLAGENDQEAVRAAGEGRAVNRHNYSIPEIEEAVSRPVVKRLLRLIQFRNSFAAFNGTFSVEASEDNTLVLSWRNDSSSCSLAVDLPTCCATITVLEGDRREEIAV